MLVTGGEPLLWPDFLAELCSGLPGFALNLKTSGSVPWESFEKCAPCFCHISHDLKHIDPAAHKRGTGADLNRILKNLRRLADRIKSGWKKTHLLVSTPVAKSHNDSEKTIREMAAFVKGLKVAKFTLIPVRQPDRNLYELAKNPYPQNVRPDSDRFRSLERLAKRELGDMYEERF